MALQHKITDADLLDYVEGRMAGEDRATMALRLADDPGLAGQCAAVRAQIVKLRMLRSIIPLEPVPREWLLLLANFERR